MSFALDTGPNLGPSSRESIGVADDIISRKRRHGDTDGSNEVLHGNMSTRLPNDQVAIDPKMDLASTRAGGVYIPPAKLRAMQAAIVDKSSEQYQRMAWDALKKSINGLINKVNTTNIKHIVPELFGENLVRGRGLFCRSIMRAQASSHNFTPVFAALVSVISSKIPEIGHLLVARLIVQLQRAYRRRDKAALLSSMRFLAQLINQQVAEGIIALQLLTLLLSGTGQDGGEARVTDDSVEVAVGLMIEVGAFLEEYSPKGTDFVYSQFREVLHAGDIQKRTQYMIEVLFQIRKDHYKDNPIIPPDLDLIEEDDKVTAPIHLDSDKTDLDRKEGLDIFKLDKDYLRHESEYENLKKEILGDESDGESGSGAEEEVEDQAQSGRLQDIQDQTNTNLVNLRKTIYLTIMSSLDFEECVHKIKKLNIPAGQELEMCNMIIECCSQERTYSRFYGLIGERFCKLHRTWSELFELAFENYYDTIHRYEINKLRNIAKFFGHLLSHDGISWKAFQCIHMNEDETTSSSRIFVKELFQSLVERLGPEVMKERFGDASMQQYYINIFPVDNPKNTRFAVNYFTQIKLGVLTEGMREWLKNAPALMMERRNDNGYSSSSESDLSPSSDSYSESAHSRSPSLSPSVASRSAYRRSYSRSLTPERKMDTERSRNGRPSESRRAREYTRSPSPYARRPARRTRSPSPYSRRPPAPGRDRSPSPYSRRPPPPRRSRSLSPYSRRPPPRPQRSPSPYSRRPPPRPQRSPSPYSRRPPAPSQYAYANRADARGPPNDNRRRRY